MIREKCNIRTDWQQKCEDVGFNFHTIDDQTYWDESHCYRFDEHQIDKLDDVTKELHDMAVHATGQIIVEGSYSKYSISETFADIIEQSWHNGDKSMYGRMDIAWNGVGEPKLLEYNADTPTSLLETSVVQWDWLVDTHKDADQFNGIHEKLVEWWASQKLPLRGLYFTCQNNVLEDINTTEYIMRTAQEAGLIFEPLVFMDEIGWNHNTNKFVDYQDYDITTLFKLYPSEWLFKEKYAAHLISSEIRLIEPAWKVITSCKAILVKMWEMYPNHPNLLATSFKPDVGPSYVRKPVFSREGANIQTCINGVISETDGLYEEPYVYQEYKELPKFDDRYTLIGSWIVGDKSAGIGIREDVSNITRNTSCFVPHYFR